MTIKHSILAVSARRLALAGLLTAALLPGMATASPFAYVPNEKSGTISIIDCATDNVVGQIKAGTKRAGWQSVTMARCCMSAISRPMPC